MILIHPPQVRNCEPPVALAHLAGALREAGETVILIDGALEAFLWLADQPAENPKDLQAKRVRKNRDSILTFHNEIDSFDRYKKRVSDIKLLVSSSVAVKRSGVRINPADYEDNHLSPLKSEDLIHSWNHPEENIFFPWFSNRLKELLSDQKEQHLGISIGFLSQALTGMAICGWIKKIYPNIKVILGGSLINSWMKGPSNMDFLYSLTDKLHFGMGEKEIVQFTGRDYRGSGIPYFSDLYEREINRNYLSPGKILPYSSALGCSWKRCTFCSETWENNPHCEKSTETVLNHLSLLTEQHNPAIIHFCESEMSPELINRLILRSPEADWYGFSRFLPSMTDIEYCQKLYNSGCRMLCLGLESGDQEVLNSLKKGIRLELVSKILVNLKEVGILTYIYIMFGTPSENIDAAFRTRDFIFDHSESISFLNVSIFNMPISSTEIIRSDSMNFYEGDLAIYKNFSHPSNWSRSKIRIFLEKDFKKVHEIGNILKRTPPIFTSSHAPFMPIKK